MRHGLWLLMSLGALSLHCGSSGNNTADGGTSDAGGSAVQACSDSAHAQCMLRDSCSGKYNTAKNFGDEPTCETRTAATCVSNLMANGTGQTPSHIETCVAEYSSFTCTDYFDGNPPGACVPPAGGLAAGTACGTSGQCASAFCAVSQDQVCGTCQPLPAPGATCQDQADCGRDLACAKAANATSGTCAAFVGSGGACLTGVSPCQAGLSCMGDNTTTMTMGTCQTAGKAGATCDSTRKTLPGCDPELGLACIPAAAGTTVGTCQAVQLVSAGATCGEIGTPVTMVAACKGGGLCVKARSTDKAGTCVAPAADGAACDSDPTKGPPCLAPAKCVPSSAGGTAGTCTLPDATKCH